MFRLVISGMLSKQVAFDPGTIEKTIKVHRSRMMEKGVLNPLQTSFGLLKSWGSDPQFPDAMYSFPLDALYWTKVQYLFSFNSHKLRIIFTDLYPSSGSVA